MHGSLLPVTPAEIRQADLVPLAEGRAQRRREAEQNGEVAPANPAARRKDFEDWAKAIGWRS